MVARLLAKAALWVRVQGHLYKIRKRVTNQVLKNTVLVCGINVLNDIFERFFTLGNFLIEKVIHFLPISYWWRCERG
jgi:hypothetical protein